jgi:hypothetical protein
MFPKAAMAVSKPRHSSKAPNAFGVP